MMVKKLISTASKKNIMMLMAVTANKGFTLASVDIGAVIL